MSLLNDITKYSNDIISGKIVACEKHIWACQRFLDDLKNAGTEEFPYIFDEAKAQRFIDWTTLFKHTKGVLAGKPIDLHIFYKFIFGNVYGWVHKDTNLRRFKKAYIQVARKNAKSQGESLSGSYEHMAFLNDEVSEVYCAATNKEQAKIVYDETKLMLQRCRALDGKWREAYRRLEHLKSGSVMRALSKEDKKNGDGLNPQCGIIDEYHAHETSEIYDLIDSGMGARQEPLIVIITTAGFNLNAPCYRIEYKLASDILDPNKEAKLETEFAVICELETNNTPDTVYIDGRKVVPGDMIDDINDEKNWIKANPIVATYPEGMQYLREKLQELKLAPEKARNVLTKHFNVWVNMKESGYMQMDRWANCAVKKEDFPKLVGERCWVGVDLSSKIDLTSVSFVFPIEDKYYVRSQSFIPGDTLHRRINSNDKMPFDYWEKEGWIISEPGNTINQSTVMNYIIKTANENGWFIEEIDFDPWSATQISGKMRDEGYETVEIRQGPRTMSEPIKQFRCEVYDKKVIHRDNPVLNWAMGNAVIDSDSNENVKFNKDKSTDRIDPAVAVINAFTRAMNCETTTSVYEKRGMRSF